jgi:DNA-binding HxlR family transcriptional regulator
MNGKADCQREECLQFIRPVRDVLDIINGKWKLPIIVALSGSNKRFKELERMLNGITARTLSKELKDLEQNELVQRTVCETSPVTVDYSLTSYGRTLDNVIAELRTWGLQHRKRIFSNREVSPAKIK